MPSSMYENEPSGMQVPAFEPTPSPESASLDRDLAKVQEKYGWAFSMKPDGMPSSSTLLMAAMLDQETRSDQAKIMIAKKKADLLRQHVKFKMNQVQPLMRVKDEIVKDVRPRVTAAVRQLTNYLQNPSSGDGPKLTGDPARDGELIIQWVEDRVADDPAFRSTLNEVKARVSRKGGRPLSPRSPEEAQSFQDEDGAWTSNEGNLVKELFGYIVWNEISEELGGAPLAATQKAAEAGRPYKKGLAESSEKSAFPFTESVAQAAGRAVGYLPPASEGFTDTNWANKLENALMSAKLVAHGRAQQAYRGEWLSSYREASTTLTHLANGITEGLKEVGDGRATPQNLMASRVAGPLARMLAENPDTAPRWSAYYDAMRKDVPGQAVRREALVNPDIMKNPAVEVLQTPGSSNAGLGGRMGPAPRPTPASPPTQGPPPQPPAKEFPFPAPQPGVSPVQGMFGGPPKPATPPWGPVQRKPLFTVPAKTPATPEEPPIEGPGMNLGGGF